MLSNKPYLLRAFYQWIVDSNCTPILAMNSNHPKLKVPQEFIDGDEILFNISPSAVRDLKILNDTIEFKASFSGVIHIITAPFRAALGVYAEENGEGIFFDADELDEETFDDVPANQVHLRGIESDLGEDASQLDSDLNNPTPIIPRERPMLKLVE